MRLKNWHPEKYNEEFAQLSMAQLREMAEIVADEARANCPVGTVSRPIYLSGPYKGESWTARDAGALKRTIRVVEKREQSGIEYFKNRNVRIYAGNPDVYYAAIVEFSHPSGGKNFMRNALASASYRLKSFFLGAA